MKAILFLLMIVGFLQADCSKLSKVLDKSYYSNVLKIMSKSYYKYMYPKETRDKQVKEINAANHVKQSVVSVINSCSTLSNKDLLGLYEVKVNMDKVIKENK